MALQIPDAFADLFRPSRYKAFYGGRGGAKSHAFAAALLVQAYQTPQRILCAREIQKSVEDSVKRLLDDKISSNTELGKNFLSLKTEIVGKNGSLIRFAGLRSNVDSIKSFEGIDKVWVEEANRVSQSSLDILIPTVRKPGSELWFSWNPGDVDDPVDAMFRGNSKKAKDNKSWAPPPGSIIREVSYADNPWFPDVLRQEMEWTRSRDPEKYAHVWLGKYQTLSEARVFRNWKIEEFETPADARFYFGADWGFSVDPTVLVRCWIKERTLYVDYEAWQVGCEIDRTPALFEKVPGSKEWPITADSSDPQNISFMSRHGYPKIRPSIKGTNSVEQGVEFLKAYDIVVHPRCVHVADELASYSFEVDKLTNEVLPKLSDKKNHTIDSLRYAVEMLRRAPPVALSLPMRS